MPKAVHCVQSGFIPPAPLVNFIRSRVYDPEQFDPNDATTRMAGTDDVWFNYAPIEEHTDRKADDPVKITSGLILINDAKHELFAGGQTYYLPPGTVFQIDVTKPHATVGDRDGLFVFLAWDSKVRRPIREFAMEATFSLTWGMLNLGMKE